MLSELNGLINAVTPLDETAMASARSRQETLAKPPRSLGRLEDLSIQLAGITGKVHNTMDRKHLLVFAADNGVVEEGVASAPQSVTLQQTVNLTRAKTGASVLCRHFGSVLQCPCETMLNSNMVIEPVSAVYAKRWARHHMKVVDYVKHFGMTTE